MSTVASVKFSPSCHWLSSGKVSHLSFKRYTIGQVKVFTAVVGWPWSNFTSYIILDFSHTWAVYFSWSVLLSCWNKLYAFCLSDWTPGYFSPLHRWCWSLHLQLVLDMETSKVLGVFFLVPVSMASVLYPASIVIYFFACCSLLAWRAQKWLGGNQSLRLMELWLCPLVDVVLLLKNQDL